jgi:hypothetical protein
MCYDWLSRFERSSLHGATVGPMAAQQMVDDSEAEAGGLRLQSGWGGMDGGESTVPEAVPEAEPPRPPCQAAGQERAAAGREEGGTESAKALLRALGGQSFSTLVPQLLVPRELQLPVKVRGTPTAL